MILKASQRGGAKQLGLHLLKTTDNEHVEVHEVRGFVAEDIVGALREAYAVSLGTRCKQFLFSVSMNPPQNESVGVEVFEQTADRIEAKTGLDGHPRVIVFHEKEGRRHAHAVWSRIDTDSMTAKNLPHFKNKLRDLSKSIYLENDWQLPRGFIDSEARDPRNFTLAEWQQAKRMGHHARDLKAMMQECWVVSDSRSAFEHALGERGILLAKGDRRGHVAVTHDGEVLSVARYVDKKAKEVRARLGEPDALPSVDDTKARFALEMGQAFKRHVGEARNEHAEEQAKLDARRQAMTAAHALERQRVDAAQRERWIEESREREGRLNSGLRGLWDRFTGRQRQTIAENEAKAFEALQRDRAQRDELVAAQLKDRQALQQEIQAARDRQAELLLLLRRDRQERQRALDVPIPREPKPPDRQEERAQTVLKPNAASLKEAFERKAAPKPELAVSFENAAKPIERTPDRAPEPRPAPQVQQGQDHEERLAALRQESAAMTTDPHKSPSPDLSQRLDNLRQENDRQQPGLTLERDRG